MYYKIAGLIVAMEPQYPPLIDQLDAYKIKEKPQTIDCKIPNDKKVIERYQAKNPELTVGEAEYLLYGAYYYDALLQHQGIFLHASCVVYKGHAYLFSANSGVGKSTHTNLWCQAFPSAFILNDDKPALKIEGDKLFAYGTPFSGKTNKNVNASYPVAGIAFIERSKNNTIKEISILDALILFMGQTMKPYKEERLDLMSETLDKLLLMTKFYSLTINMEEDAVLTAYQAMKPNK